MRLRLSKYFSLFRILTIAVMAGIAVSCGTTGRITHNEPSAPPQSTEPDVEPTTEQPEDSSQSAPFFIQRKEAQTPSAENLINPEEIPDTPREMRAAWVASVANIDWPSEPGLPVAQQKAELLDMLDRAVELNLNAIFLQVRPAADALYKSPYEPWSEFLTGTQGKAPEPFYDPLTFAVKEAHLRGLELHAWFNPFRAHHYAEKARFASSHIKNRRPDLVVRYGRYWWLDPGQEDARDYSINVILDVARRYDIDGVHLDDYFYPYYEKNSRGHRIPFPDDKSYRKYVKEHGAIARDDWRRQNIDQFVQRLQHELKNVNPNIRFGISPFGIWRPGNPPQITGFDAYANLYADAKKWLNKGWVDYISPQLYWPIDKQAQSFPVLLKWWEEQNTYGRHLWPGLYTNQVGNKWNSKEISQQIQLTRDQLGASGAIHFSMRSLMGNNDDIAPRLANGVYSAQALVPATTWISNEKPPQPKAVLDQNSNYVFIALRPDEAPEPWLWVLKTNYDENWHISILPGWKRQITLPIENENGDFRGAVLYAVNELSNQSAGQILLPILGNVETTAGLTPPVQSYKWLQPDQQQAAE